MKRVIKINLRILMQKNLRQFYHNQNLEIKFVKIINLIQKEECSLYLKTTIKLINKKNSHRLLMLILDQ